MPCQRNSRSALCDRSDCGSTAIARRWAFSAAAASPSSSVRLERGPHRRRRFPSLDVLHQARSAAATPRATATSPRVRPRRVFATTPSPRPPASSSRSRAPKAPLWSGSSTSTRGAGRSRRQRAARASSAAGRSRRGGTATSGGACGEAVSRRRGRVAAGGSAHLRRQRKRRWRARSRRGDRNRISSLPALVAVAAGTRRGSAPRDRRRRALRGRSRLQGDRCCDELLGCAPALAALALTFGQCGGTPRRLRCAA